MAAMATKKDTTFDRKKLNALTAPISLTVQKQEGGKNSLLTLPPLKDGWDSGKGFEADDFESLVYPAIAVAGGGGMYLCQATDNAGNSYEWTWWVDPVYLPSRPSPAVIAAAQAGPTPPMQPPLPPPQAPAWRPPVAPPTPVYVDQYGRAVQMTPMGPVYPPPQAPPQSMAPGPYGWNPYAPYQNFAAPGQMPYPPPPYPGYPGYPGAPQQNGSPTGSGVHDKALELEKEKLEFQKVREIAALEAKHREEMDRARQQNERLEKRLSDLELAARAPAANAGESETVRMLREQLARLEQRLESRAQDDRLTTLAHGFEQKFTALQTQMQAANKPDELQAVMNGFKDVTRDMLGAISTQGSKALTANDMISLMTTLLGAVKSASTNDQLVPMFNQILSGVGQAVGLIRDNTPSGPNPIAQAATEAGGKLLETLQSYVQGKRNEAEAKSNVEVLRAQADVVRAAQPQNQAPQNGAAVPTMATPPTAAPTQPLAGAQPQPQQAPPTAASAAEPADVIPMNATDQERWEYETFGPARNSILQLRNGVEVLQNVTADQCAEYIWAGFKNPQLISVKDRVKLYQLVERQLWKDLFEAICPNTHGAYKYRVLELLRTYHARENGMGTPQAAAPPSQEQAPPAEKSGEGEKDEEEEPQAVAN